MTKIIEQLMKEQQSLDVEPSIAIATAWPKVLKDRSEPPTEPEAAIHWMNNKHFVVREAGKTLVMTEELDQELNRHVLKRSSFDDIRKFYCNKSLWIPAPKERWSARPLGHYWLNHQRRRQYEGIVLAPGGAKRGYYNLWRGFSVQPLRGDWSLMASHIEKIICAGNPEVYRYVRRWMALAVQKPDVLPEVALVMRGKQGTGKGVFARGFGALFGQHFLHVSRARHLVGNFNAHLRDAIVVFADEAFLAGDKDAEGSLKALITEPELSVEGKFRDVVTCRNLIHLIIASNNDQIINAAAEERRFCVLDVSDAHIQDHDYFAAILNQMKDGGLAAMLYDLQDESLARFNPRDIPVTKALNDQKIRSMADEELWWFKKLQAGCLLKDNEEWPKEVMRDELVDDYHNWSGRRDRTTQDLRNALAKLLPEGYPRQGARLNVGGARKRTWVLPTLKHCRDRFANIFRMGDCWSDDESVKASGPTRPPVIE